VLTEHAGKIIHQLYDALLDESAFQPAMAALSRFMGERRTMLLNWNGALPDSPEVVSTVDANGLTFDSFLQQYGAYYHRIDPSKQQWGATAEGCWLHEGRALAPRLWDTEQFYQDFALRQQVVGWSVLKIADERNHASQLGWAITFMQDSGSRALDADALECVRTVLAPHLRRAVRLRTNLADLRRLAEAGLAMLDNCVTPLWLLERDGLVRFANVAAERYLRRADAVLHVRAGRLRPRVQGPGNPGPEQWEALLADDGRLVGMQSGGLRLRRADGAPAAVQCLPLPAAAALAADRQRPMRMLVLHDRADGGHGLIADYGLLRQIYGLTPAEIRVVQGLMQDLTIAEIAQRLQVGAETVRSQAKSILHKCGCRRQAELVRMLAGLHAFTAAHPDTAGGRPQTAAAP